MIIRNRIRYAVPNVITRLVYEDVEPVVRTASQVVRHRRAAESAADDADAFRIDWV